ncbi:amidohydrolase family protein [Thermodesulfobacteriota bacterium]
MGTVSPGKLADLIVLNDDPTRLRPDEIRELEVVMTIVDGKIVWDKSD